LVRAPAAHAYSQAPHPMQRSSTTLRLTSACFDHVLRMEVA
jgi:hypothetical protein